MLFRDAEQHSGDVILVQDFPRSPESSYVLYLMRAGKHVNGLPTRKLIPPPSGCQHDWQIVTDPFCSNVDGSRSLKHSAYRCRQCLCTAIYCMGGKFLVLGTVDHSE